MTKPYSFSVLPRLLFMGVTIFPLPNLEIAPKRIVIVVTQVVQAPIQRVWCIKVHTAWRARCFHRSVSRNLCIKCKLSRRQFLVITNNRSLLSEC